MTILFKEKMKKYIAIFIVVFAGCLFGGQLFARVSVGNIDASYAIERVTVSRDGAVYAWNRKGDVIDGWPLEFGEGGGDVVQSPRLVDVTRDGHDEVVLLLRNAAGAYQMRVINGAGEELASWRYDIPSTGGAPVMTPIVADINEDSRLEVAYATEEGRVFVARHAAGYTPLSAFTAQFDRAPQLIAADLDNDGRPWLTAIDETAGEIRVWEADGVQRTIFALPDGEGFRGGAALIDVDGDGRPEVVSGTTVRELIAVDHQGAVVARYPLPLLPVAAPLIADIDLDMQPDILVLLSDRSLYAVHRDGSRVRRWDWHLPFEAGSSLTSGIVAFDLYEGLLSSISGWDQAAVYKVSRDRFVEMMLGENVHAYDRLLAEMEMPVVAIENVLVQPKLITPNGDGYNDEAELSYLLSDDAAVTVDLLDAAGNELFQIVEGDLQTAGENAVRIAGVNTKGTATPNDDEPLPKGLYAVRLTTTNDLGLSSRVTTPLIVFGVRAEIDFPLDDDEGDDRYPAVHGVVSVSGIATDPNIGEGSDDFDFLAYKVYVRPGIWTVDEAAALAAGEVGSPWQPVPVPIQHQSPLDIAREPADALYPHANVSVRPVQHGLLAQWDTTDAVETPNGLYTLLLKTMDGNGNAVERVNFDSIVVDVRNVPEGTPYDPNDPATDPDDPENLGPELKSVQVSPTRLTTQTPQVAISYALHNETSNVTIALYRVLEGGETGTVVASFAQGAQAPGSYNFTWNGKDNVNKRVDIGSYRARISAAAVDGTGGASAETDEIWMGIATEYNVGLAILDFALSGDLLDPFDTITDENGEEVLAEELTVSYGLNRYARLRMGVYDETGALVRTLIDGIVDKIGSRNWSGADDLGRIVPAGSSYTIRLTAECIDAGCDDVQEEERDVSVRALSLGGLGLSADIEMLIGEEQDGGSTPDELAGILRDDDDPLNDYPLNGSADFSWRAYGKGYLRIPFTYDIQARGQELFFTEDHREEVITPQNVPLTTITCTGDSLNPVEYDFRLHPSHSESVSLNFDSSYSIIQYGVDSVDVPNGITMALTTPHGGQEIAAPFHHVRSNIDLANHVTIGVGLRGRPRGENGIPREDQYYIIDRCSHGRSTALCDALGYQYNPTNLFLSCPFVGIGQTKTSCSYWFEWSSPVVVGPDAVIAPVACGRVRVWADARREAYRNWGPFSSVGNALLHSMQNPGVIHISQYSGATSSGAPDVISSTVSDYILTFTPRINGRNWPITRSSGYLTVGGAIRAWLGSTSGPGDGGNLYADILPNNYETDDDPRLADNACVFDGAKYINGALDTNVQSTSHRCIVGEVSGINKDFFQLDSGPFSIYAAHPITAPITNTAIPYTFSDAVHIDEWTVDLRYPDGSINDSFDVREMWVNSSGTRDVDGDGSAESNKNTNDTFDLRLKSNAAPKRFIEIRGIVNGATWELRYFDARSNAWGRIADGMGGRSGTLAWWDVSRRNGHNYTVFLRVIDDAGMVASEDTMEVAIGSPVQPNTEEVVTSPYGRYAIHFDEFSLCPDGGSYPCDASLEELVTVTPIAQDTPGLYLPSGIHPIGPVVEIKPDDIELSQIYQPQLEVFFTREEVEALYQQEPQAVQDYVYGITANDPPVMALYNLKDDGELEQLATINTWDDRGTPGTGDDLFRISGLLSHFSRYLLMREDDSYPRLTMTSPGEGAVLHGIVAISGEIGGIGSSDSISELSVRIVDEEGDEISLPVDGDSSFEVTWDTRGVQGWRTIKVAAITDAGDHADASVRVYVDNSGPRTMIVVNEQLVESGGLAVVPSDGEVMLISEDSIDRQGTVESISYRWDDEAYQTYEGVLPLNAMAAGRHSFSCYAVDDIGNQEEPQSVFITIIDPDEPTGTEDIATHVEFGEPTHSDGHQDWVGPTTPILLSEDEGSTPVHQIRYRINDDDYRLYEEPFTLGDAAEGAYEVEYFGIDFYGLTEALNSHPIIVDRTAPETGISVEGGPGVVDGRLFVTDATRISLTAEDGGLLPAGVERIEYAFDSGEWMRYDNPIAVAKGDGDEILLEVQAVDRVGNISDDLSIRLLFNAEAPQVEMVTAPEMFSPNGDGVLDSATWHLRLLSSLGDSFRAMLYVDDFEVGNAIGEPGEFTLTWDGLFSGQPAADGEHGWRIIIFDGYESRSSELRGSVVVDRTKPTIVVTATSLLGGGASLHYHLDDNVSPQQLITQLSVRSGGQVVATATQQADVPAVEHVISWDGANQYQGAAYDGSYAYELSATDTAGNISIAASGYLSIDSRPPQSRLVILGPFYEENDVLWIGPLSRIALTAADMSGTVDRVEYAMGGDEWSLYQQPLSIAAPGLHSLQYRAVDAIGNVEPENEKRFTADFDVPASELHVDGVQRVIEGVPHWSGTATFLQVNGSDGGVGVERSLFEVDQPAVHYRAEHAVALGSIGYGERTGRYWSEDRVGNQEEKREVHFVIHGQPPALSLEVGTPQYQAPSALFVSKQTPLRVRANSAMPDIVYLQYTIDNAGRIMVGSPGAADLAVPAFTIPDEGYHTIRYFTVDDFENRSELARTLVVDGSPPQTVAEMSQEAVGEESLATPSTVIRLNASDQGAGVWKTEYALDNGAWEEYAAPFDLKGLSTGWHEVHYQSSDMLNQGEIPHTMRLEILSLNHDIERIALPRILLFLLPDSNRPGLDPLMLDEVRLLYDTCEERGWPFLVVDDPISFRHAMRGDAFNVFAFASVADGYQFDGTVDVDALFRELAARILKGDTLMLLPSSFSTEGVAWERMLDRFGGIEGVPVQSGVDRVLLSAQDDDSHPVLLLSADALSFSGNVEALYHLDSDVVVARRGYGAGSLLLLGMPLDAWRTAFDTAQQELEDTTDVELENGANVGWGELWNDMLSGVVRMDEHVSPNEVISLAVHIAANTRPARARLSGSVPAESSWLDSIGNALSSPSRLWFAEILSGEQATFIATLRVPSSGNGINLPMSIATDWYNGLNDQESFIWRYELAPPWSVLWQNCLGAIRLLREESTTTTAADAMLSVLEGLWAEADDASDWELRIAAVLTTIDRLDVLSGERVSDLKHDLAELVEVLQAASARDGLSAAAFDVTAMDTDHDGLPDDVEVEAETDVYDADTDDDGVLDGQEVAALEDSDGDGWINALDDDSDNDGLRDGLEMGVTGPADDPDGYGPLKSTADSSESLAVDTDPATTTNMASADTDGGGLPDGDEDINANGFVDPGETDPNNPADDSNPTHFTGGGGGGGCELSAGTPGQNDVLNLLMLISISILFGLARMFRPTNPSRVLRV